MMAGGRAQARIRSLVGSLVLAPALIACTAMPLAPGAPPPTLNDTTWTLATLTGLTLPAAAAPTLRFEAGRVQGSDGCNRYGGPFTANEGRLQIGPHLMSTRMACPEPVGATAAAFTAALERARSYRFEGLALVLMDDGGATLASFTPQGPKP